MNIRRSPGRSVAGPDVPFDWIDTPAQLEEVIDEVLQHEAYAIDTEFLRERTYYPKLALVQLDYPGRTVLIDPLAVPIQGLSRLLDADIEAVFHAADQDLEVLELACGVVPRRIFDTQLAAGFLGFSTPSLLSLAERVLRIRLSKGDRLTDWTLRPLTQAQCAYAASDVTHLLEIRSLLLGELASVGRVDWVSAETELMRLRPRGQQDPRKAWWRLKDGRVLRGSDRLVAQELCIWREQRAQAEDRPIRYMLADLAVLAIAQARPTSQDALMAIRGIDGRALKGGAAKEILEVIRRAASMDIAELELPPQEDFDRRLRPALTLVSAWIGQLAQDARIDQGILATRSDLVDFLRNNPDARLRSGWRAGLVGDRIGQLVSGDAALAFEPSGTLVLERRSGDRLGSEVAVPSADWILPADTESLPAD